MIVLYDIFCLQCEDKLHVLSPYVILYNCIKVQDYGWWQVIGQPPKIKMA